MHLPTLLALACIAVVLAMPWAVSFWFARRRARRDIRRRVDDALRGGRS